MERTLTLAAVAICLGFVTLVGIYRSADRWIEPGGSLSGLGRATLFAAVAFVGAIAIATVALATSSRWLPNDKLWVAQIAVGAVSLVGLLLWINFVAGHPAPSYSGAKPVLDFEVRTARSYLKDDSRLTFYF